MNYRKIYDCIIERSKSRSLVKEIGYEIHHIIPKSFGGSNAKENLVKLTYREHYIAHRLLVKFSVGKEKHSMIWALKRFINSTSHMVNSRDYAIIKELHRESCSIYGKGRKVSDEVRKNMSIAQKKRYSVTPSHWNGRHHNKDTIEKMQRWQQSNSPMRGKFHTDESKVKIGNAARNRPVSEETIKKKKSLKMSDEAKSKISESLRKYHKARKEGTWNQNG